MRRSLSPTYTCDIPALNISPNFFWFLSFLLNKIWKFLLLRCFRKTFYLIKYFVVGNKKYLLQNSLRFLTRSEFTLIWVKILLTSCLFSKLICRFEHDKLNKLISLRLNCVYMKISLQFEISNLSWRPKWNRTRIEFFRLFTSALPCKRS